MTPADIQSQSTLLLWFSFAVSFVFGAVAQRTHFCTMGALSDLFNMGDATRLRQWALAVAVAALGFGVLVHLGKLDASKTLYATPRWMWLSALTGGLMFGFGMVLASGCGSKTLVRAGAGNLKAMVVFVVMGVSAFATLRGITAVLRDASVDKVFVSVEPMASLPMWLTSVSGMSPQNSALLCALVFALALLIWVARDRGFFNGHNLLAGLGIGGTVLAMWWGSGVLGHVPEHPDTLQQAFLTTGSGRIEAMTFTAPMAYSLDWLMFFSDKSKVLTWSVVSVVGVLIGSWLMALVGREFRWESFRDTEDTANHLIGAVLMGVGGVTALGCTVGQGLSGLSTLSLTSFVAVAAIAAGARLAFAYQMWRLERQSA
jgi:uncharacterized membrane protein YedE/YeeE